MPPLNLRPLPLHPAGEPSRAADEERGAGFVDDAVILAIVAGPPATRQGPLAANPALAASEMDFAGWRLPAAPPAAASQPGARRAAPPAIEEPGIGEPHRGSHRWWLAGLAGATSTLLFSALLLTLASRTRPEDERVSIIRPQAAPQVNAEKPPAAPQEGQRPSKVSLSRRD